MGDGHQVPGGATRKPLDFLSLGGGLVDGIEAALREAYPDLDVNEFRAAVVTACSAALALAAKKHGLSPVSTIQNLVDNINDVTARARAEKREN